MKSYSISLISVLFLCLPVVFANVNLTQCRDDIRTQTGWNSSLIGSSLNDPGKNITYDQCKLHCGASVGVFDWTPFSQNFSTWLLPWIALIFQLPFGADDRFDNLVAVLLAIGSPALAGYSLAITRLNGRWLAREFSDRVTFPNDNIVPTAFTALQHIPIKLVEYGALLPSLVVLPQNDQWWTSMARMAKKTRQWNMPAAMNIMWVTVAFLLTIVDSFADFDNFLTIPGDSGYALVAVWSYLLPLVVGWLNVGSQPEADHLRVALEEANANAWIATPGEPIVASSVAGRPSRAIEYAKRNVSRVQSDEKRTSPIFNYSRVFLWSQQAQRILKLYESASAKADQKISVSGEDWYLSEHGVDRRNRTGGTETQVVGYCTDSNSVPFAMAMGSLAFPEPMNSPYTPGLGPYTPSPYTPEAKFLPELPSYFSRRNTRRPLWAPHVFERVAFAFCLGILLQWGSSGAAVMIHMETPPKGIGCRSLTFTLYGVVGTIVFLSMFLSSILAHRARPSENSKETTITQDIQGVLAIALRWNGKVLGVLNGVGIIVASIMQFAGVFDNCFCSSNVFGGTDKGVLYLLESSEIKGSEVVKFWIGGVIMAFGCATVFASAIYVGSPMD